MPPRTAVTVADLTGSSGRASVSFPPLRQRRLVAPPRLVVVHPHAILAAPPAALALDRRLGGSGGGEGSGEEVGQSPSAIQAPPQRIATPNRT